jgi:hypothetical protein
MVVSVSNTLRHVCHPGPEASQSLIVLNNFAFTLRGYYIVA